MRGALQGTHYITDYITDRLGHFSLFGLRKHTPSHSVGSENIYHPTRLSLSLEYSNYHCKKFDNQLWDSSLDNSGLIPQPQSRDSKGKFPLETVRVGFLNFAKLSPSFSSAGLSLALMLISPNKPNPPTTRQTGKYRNLPEVEIQARYPYKTYVSLI